MAGEYNTTDEHDTDVENSNGGMSDGGDMSASAVDDSDFDSISSNDAENADVVGSDMEDDDVSFVLSDDDMPSDRGGSNGLSDKDNNTPHGCPTHESPEWPLPSRDFYMRLT